MTVPYLPANGRMGDGGGDGRYITADGQTLMRQGCMTAYEYLLSAIGHIDAELGKGYAKAHPELIGAFMQAAAVDCSAATIAKAVQEIAPALDRLADAVPQDDTNAFPAMILEEAEKEEERARREMGR